LNELIIKRYARFIAGRYISMASRAAN